ncbi:(d)CMP kinase [Anditalea andensis]|uniref:Cytidylate kinase n=1 Tax=Anditalea andensis TaxID=1048983 RepID=A0A074KYT4_9BACT|nr:(d)CMP kinase [Anditalea andensis]KEO72788.1 cytidylate kinase [Anditalea andensis]
MKKIVIAIDGYSGCGKSTTAKAVAKALNYTYIDSGAMYRATTLHFINSLTNITNPREITKSLDAMKIEFHKNEVTGFQETFLNGLNVEKTIRQMEVSERVSDVSKIKEVRTALVAQQHRLGKYKGVVMDGRDIGTVVFPDAELKIFMTADLTIRAERRQQELLEKGDLVELDKIIQNLAERDRIDSSREISPLKKADGAIEINTSYLDFEDQVNNILELAHRQIGDKQIEDAGNHR